jgi:hypothetical protein
MAPNTSKTSVNFYKTTRRNNPEENHFHTRRRENLKSHFVYYCVHKSQPLDNILSQVNKDHNLLHYFFKIHFNIILPSTPRSSSGFFPSGYRLKFCYSGPYTLHLFYSSDFPLHLIVSDLITTIMCVVETTAYEALHYANIPSSFGNKEGCFR